MGLYTLTTPPSGYTVGYHVITLLYYPTVVQLGHAWIGVNYVSITHLPCRVEGLVYD